MGFRSIRRRLAFAATGLVLAVVGAIAGVAYREVRRSAINSATEHLASVSRQLADLYGASAHQVLAQATATARDSSVVALLGSPNEHARAAALNVLRRFGGAGSNTTVELWDADGVRVLANRNLSPLPRDIAEPLTARLVRNERGHPDSIGVISPIVDVADTLGYQVAAAVLRPGNDKPIGFVVQRRQVRGSAQSIAQLSKLVGPDATLLIGNAAGGLWTDMTRRAAGPPRGAVRANNTAEYTVDGQPALAGVTAIANTPWALAVESTRDAALRPVYTMLWRLAVVTLLLLIAAAFGTWIMSGTLTRPIAQLAHAAEAIGAGRYSAHLPIERRDELGAVATAFNTMTDQVAAALGALGAKIGELESTEARYRMLFDASPQPMWVYDLETQRFLAVNDAAVQKYGYSRDQFLAMTICDIRPAEDVPALLEDLTRLGAEGGARAETWRHRTASGTILDVEVHSRPLRFADRVARLVLVNDLTARRRAEEAARHLEQQLQHAQKMEAVGRLAGGIAHDFNNLLTVMLAECQMLLEGTMSKDEQRESIEEVRKAGDRAALLTRQLLTFSRRQLVEPASLDVNSIVSDVYNLVARLIGEDIEVRLRLAAEPTTTLADLGQIEQVIVNLAVNARDAMPRGGVLTVETSLVELDKTYCDTHPDAAPGPYVMLAISDTGTGMTPDVQAHAFEPFFTTKEVGKGTGLGLATCYSIAKQFRGHIGVYSEVGIGTTMKLYLPYTMAVAAEAGQQALAAPSRGSETILLVEDEPTVRRLAAKILTGRGYTVLQASNAGQALEWVTGRKGDIHLLLTDVVLPKTGGRELAEQITRLRPAIRVLFMSGYSDDVVLQHKLTEHDVMLVQKPFTAEALAAKVRDAMVQPRRGVAA